MAGALSAGWPVGLRQPAVVLPVSLALVALIAVSDYLTGYEIRLAIFYLVPIGLVTWVLGAAAGALISLVAALCWVFAFQSNHPYPDPFYFYLEGAITGVTFLVIVGLLASLQRALERSDERFVVVLEELDTAVSVTDAATGEILFTNRQFRERFRDNPYAGPPRGRAEPVELFDGWSGRWYLVHERDMRWLDGRVARLRILADITDLKQAATSAQRHRDVLDRSSRLVALGELGSALAHELNQPLGAIATYLETAQRLVGKGRDIELAGAIDKSRAQASRAGSIVQRLREFLRYRRPEREATDVAAVARSALRLVDGEAAGAGVAIEPDLAADLPRASADPLLLEQVLVNLLRNALEALQAAGRNPGRIVLSAQAGTDGALVVSVTDNGPGIEPDVAARLYDAFFTTKQGGLGLGLGICRSIVEAHGGRMWHEGAAGAGAAFHFTLPARHE